MSAEKTVKLFRENMLQEAAKEGFYRNKGKGSSGDFEFVWVTPEGTETSSTEYVEEQYMDPGAWTGDWQEPSGDVKDGILRHYAQRFTGAPGGVAKALNMFKDIYTHTGPAEEPLGVGAVQGRHRAPRGSGGDVSATKKKKKVKRRRRRAGVRFTGAGTKALRGGGIKVLQQLLFALGFGGKNEKKFVDGINGPNTLKALRAFQKTHKKPNGEPLQVDGVVGKNSAPALLDAAEGATMTQDERDDMAIAQFLASKARAPRGAPSTAAPAGEREAAEIDPEIDPEAAAAQIRRALKDPGESTSTFDQGVRSRGRTFISDPKKGGPQPGAIDQLVHQFQHGRWAPRPKASPSIHGRPKKPARDSIAGAYTETKERESLQRRNKKMVNQEQLRELIKEAIAEADLDLLELYKTQHKAQGKINEKVKYFWEDDDEDEEETSAEIEAAVDKGGRAKEKKFRPRSPTGGDTVDLKKSHDKLASAFRGGSHSLADDDTEFKPFKPKKKDIAHAVIEPGETRKKRRRARGVRFAGKSKQAIGGVEQLQRILQASGAAPSNPKFVDGRNGPGTLTALKTLQRTQLGKKDADGVVGPKTLKMLKKFEDHTARYYGKAPDPDRAELRATLKRRDRQREFDKRKKDAPAVAKLPGSPGATGVTAESLRKDLLEEACGVPAKRYRIKRR